MTALIWKELRALRPYVLLILGIVLAGTAYEFATSFPDSNLLTMGSLLEDSDKGIFTLVLALMVAAALLTRESDEGTLSFLDGLPVSRTQVFVAKSISGLLVLLLIAGTGIAYELATGLLSRTSVGDPLPWRGVAVFTWVNVVVAIYALGIGLLLSFLRQWLVLVSGLIFWGFAWLSAREATWHLWLNPYALFSDLSSPGTPVPWGYIGVQARHCGRRISCRVALLLRNGSPDTGFSRCCATRAIRPGCIKRGTILRPGDLVSGHWNRHPEHRWERR